MLLAYPIRCLHCGPFHLLPQEQELLSAIRDYEQQLQGLEDVLQQGDDDAELRDMKGQLQEAVQQAREAYVDCFGDVPEPPGTSTDAAVSRGTSQRGNLSPAAKRQRISPTNEPQASQRQGTGPTAIVPSPSGALLPSGNPAAVQADGRQRAAAAAAPQRQGPNSGGANPKIHPSNRYCDQEPDFAALAQQYPEFGQYVTIAPGGGRQVWRPFDQWLWRRESESFLRKTIHVGFMHVELYVTGAWG